MQLAQDQQEPATADTPQRVLRSHISEAVQLRQLLGLPSSHTNAYRLVNRHSPALCCSLSCALSCISQLSEACPSEGDRLSGLVVDVLGDTLVVASSAAWVERYRSEIESCLRDLTGKRMRAARPTEKLVLGVCASTAEAGVDTQFAPYWLWTC